MRATLAVDVFHAILGVFAAVHPTLDSPKIERR